MVAGNGQYTYNETFQRIVYRELETKTKRSSSLTYCIRLENELSIGF